jgi:hypothetical protein
MSKLRWLPLPERRRFVSARARRGAFPGGGRGRLAWLLPTAAAGCRCWLPLLAAAAGWRCWLPLRAGASGWRRRRAGRAGRLLGHGAPAEPVRYPMTVRFARLLLT